MREKQGSGRTKGGPDRAGGPFTPAPPAPSFEELLAAFPVPLLLFDPGMIIINANALAVEAFGFDPTGLSRDSMLEKIDIQERPGARDRTLMSDGAVEGGAARQEFYRFRDAAGGLHMAIGFSAPVVRGEEMIGVISTWIDITERARAEEMLAVARDRLEDELVERTTELIESQELLEEISSSMHLLVAGLDTSFRYLRVNETFARALGRRPEHFPGKNHFELFPSERTKRRFEQTVRSRRTLNSKSDNLFSDRAADQFYDWSLHPVLDQNGEVDELLLVAVDVNLRMKALADLRAATDQIKQAKPLSDIGTLAATVAHELRNPLGVIKTAVFNIRRKNADPALERHIVNIEKKIDESSTIINNLLNYSRMRTPRLERLRLSDIVSESVTSARRRFRTHPATISKNLRKLRGVFVMGDPSQLGMVFNNILNNAVQAIDGAGEVRIAGAVEKDDTAAVEIVDSGCGIEARDIERVFDPFFTLKAKGTGLGLAVTREILGPHKGSISIRSEPGAGTAVTVRLPLDGRRS